MSIFDDIQNNRRHYKESKESYFSQQRALDDTYVPGSYIGRHSFNDNQAVLAVKKGLFFGKNVYIKYESLIGVSVLASDHVVDTRTTTTKHKGAVGRAVVGGALFSAPGAIVGGLTSKKISETKGSVSNVTTYSLKIYIDDEYMRSIDVDYSDVLKDKIENIISIRNNAEKINESDLVIDKKIRKLKHLLQKDVITSTYYDKAYAHLIEQKGH